MKIQIIIQARLNSSRLPKKVLHQIKGKSLLDYLVKRLSFLSDTKICIATSDQSSDNDIENYCEKNNILCFRGSLNDVSKRMLNAAKYYNSDAFIRVNGDSPMIYPQIVEKATSLYKNGNYDLVTNTFPRSFPVGQSVEVIRTSAFEIAYKKMSTNDHFEHVSKYYYERPNEFRIKNFSNNKDLSKYRLVLDTPEDLERMKTIMDSMTKPHSEYSMDELIEIYPSA